MGKIFAALEKQGEKPRIADDASAAVADTATSPPAGETGRIDDGKALPLSPSSIPPSTATSEDDVIDTSRWDVRLRLCSAADSTIAENFRKVRNTILHPPSGTIPRSILVTSAMPEEGKSFVCANLGISLAQSLEQHSLIVDCDLRRPTQANLFGIAKDKGLTSYLRNEEQLPAVIRKTGLPKLSLIPSGPVTTNPAELLDTTAMQHLMAELVARYPDRSILFDSPPLQAAAETTVLARHADAVVLVVRWGKSGREQVRKVVEAIGREKIIGVIFNAFEVSALDNALYKKGYYGYYGSGYAY